MDKFSSQLGFKYGVLPPRQRSKPAASKNSDDVTIESSMSTCDQSEVRNFLNGGKFRLFTKVKMVDKAIAEENDILISLQVHFHVTEYTNLSCVCQ